MVSIRKARPNDKNAIMDLHRSVARISQGIARTEAELTESYFDTLFRTVDIMLVGTNEANQVIAEIHASKYGLRIFDHILTGLTIAVHPDYQGKGIGKKLFQAFLEEIQQTFPEVIRIELESRASNQKSIGLYRSIEFVEEGRMKNKTRNIDGSFEDSLLMAWTKPSFDFTN
ncbi:GNAT family N-acetyltransferase [Spirosoma harenae]